MINNYAYTVVGKFEIFHFDVFCSVTLRVLSFNFELVGDLKIFVFHGNYCFCYIARVPYNYTNFIKAHSHSPTANPKTRMHSSRMRTGRSLTVCWNLLLGGGVSALGGVCSRGCLLRGVSAWGGVCSGGCLLLGVSALGVSALGGVCSRGVWYPSMH